MGTESKQHKWKVDGHFGRANNHVCHQSKLLSSNIYLYIIRRSLIEIKRPKAYKSGCALSLNCPAFPVLGTLETPTLRSHSNLISSLALPGTQLHFDRIKLSHICTHSPLQTSVQCHLSYYTICNLFLCLSLSISPCEFLEFFNTVTIAPT